MPTRRLGAIGALTLLTTAASAWADEPPKDEDTHERYPIRFVERPLTLPRHGLVAGFAIPVATAPGRLGRTERAVGFAAGGSFGVSDDFEVSASPVVLQLAPELLLGDATLAARYRFRGNDAIEVASTLRLKLPFQEALVATPQVNVRIHAGDVFALDTGALLEFRFSNPSIIAFGVPIRPTLQLGDHVFVGLDSALLIATLDLPVDSIIVPLAVSAGVSVGDDRPVADLRATVEFPLFWIPAADDSLVTELYVLRVTASFYFFL
ncbi:MAG: hypothetical protein RIT81_24380 [Deltaproteobacteria bacterium]